MTEEITKEQTLKGSRWDDTLTVEGDTHVDLVEVDGMPQVRSGRWQTSVGRAGDEVLAERTQYDAKANPCDKYGHKPNGDGSACRFCGTPL